MENEARGGCACGAVITVTVWLDRVDKYRSERRNVVVEPLLTSDERRPCLGVQADVELDHKHALAGQSRSLATPAASSAAAHVAKPNGGSRSSLGLLRRDAASTGRELA